MDAIKEILVTPEQAKLMAEAIIKTRWGVKNPPPWLMAAVTHTPYSLSI